MPAIDDLKAAGFSDDEVTRFATEKRAALVSGGFSHQEADDYLGQSTMATAAEGNKSLARTLGDAFTRATSAVKTMATGGSSGSAEPAQAAPAAPKAPEQMDGPSAGEKMLQTTKDIGTVYGPIEGVLNATTGLLFGFPAQIVGAIGGLTNKYLLNGQADPAEVAAAAAKIFTYQPFSEPGKRIAGNLMLPFQKLAEAGEAVGHYIVDQGVKRNWNADITAAAAAVTDNSIQMLTPVLGLSLARRTAGYTPTAEDVHNVAKVIADEAGETKPANGETNAPAGETKAPPTAEAVSNVEASLRNVYSKLGIDPLTVNDVAKQHPEIIPELLAAGDGIPKKLALEAGIEQPETLSPVYRDVVDGLAAIEHGTPEYRHNAGLLNYSFFESMAKRTGVPIDTLWQKYRPELTDRQPNEAALAQGPKTALDIQQAVMNDHPKVNVALTEHPTGLITVDAFELRNMAADEGKGYGPEAMKALTSQADAAGKPLMLIATPAKGSARTLPDLVRFYEKNGFYKETEQPYSNAFIMSRDAKETQTRQEGPGAGEPAGAPAGAGGDLRSQTGQAPAGDALSRTLFQGEQKPTSWYYSELGRQIEARGSLKASPEQWKSTIANLKGVKADEIKWSGIEDWLELQKAAGEKVTKDQVLDFLRANGVQVKEVMLGDGKADVLARQRLEDIGQRIGELESQLESLGEAADPFEARALHGEIADLEQESFEIEARAESNGEQAGMPKFQQYVLPGGRNYRELLLTLPQREPSAKLPAGYKVEPITTRDGSQEFTLIGPDNVGRLLRDNPDAVQATEHAIRLLRSEGKMPREGDNRFTSSHFDQPNILAHIRFDDRTDAAGKSVLFIEEFQSDWAQQGKKKGFAQGDKAPPSIDELKQHYGWKIEKAPDVITTYRLADETGRTMSGPDYSFTSEAQARSSYLSKTGFDIEADNLHVVPHSEPAPSAWEITFDDDSRAYFDTEENANAVLQREWEKDNESGSKVPAAPFVEKTEAWVTLAAKRMIRYAAEHGYDSIAWTTGEQQVSRYTSALRKAVDAIEWTKTDKGVQLVGYKGKDNANGVSFQERSRLEEIANDARRVARDAIRANDNLGFDSASEAMENVWRHRTDWTARWGDLSIEAIASIQTFIDRHADYLKAEKTMTTRQKVVDTTEKEDALSDAIGKAMAEKIISDPAQTGTIEGEDIHISDTGMAAFYDKIVPNIVNKVLKQLGGGKVGAIDMKVKMPREPGNEFDYAAEDGGTFEITDGNGVAVETGIATREQAASRADDLNAGYATHYGQNQHGFEITPAMRDKVMGGLPLFQGGPERPRGYLQKGPAGERTMGLLAEADPSTYVHESGHFFLDVMADLARGEHAPADIAQDMQRLYNWMGVKDAEAWHSMTLEEQRPMHEKFARAFERYLAEGRAPAPRLQAMFDRFKAWMLDVYKSLKNMGVKINDETRGVMDRMLAGEPIADLKNPKAELDPWLQEQPPAVEKPLPMSQGLDSPDMRAMLEHMANYEAGWEQIGGKLDRGRMADAGLIDEHGQPTKLGTPAFTEWIPKAEWWPDKPKGATEAKVKLAIKKALAGEPLKALEQRIVDYMMDVANERLAHVNEIGEDVWTDVAREVATEGLEPTTENVVDADAVARAVERDADAVEAAATQHADNDAAFMAEIRRINGDEKPGEGAAGSRDQAGRAEEGSGGEAPGEAGSEGGRELARGPETPGSLDVSGPTADELAREGSEPKIVNMNLGISPAEALAAVRDSYTPYVGVEMTKFPSSPIVDAIWKVIAPGSRGPIAKRQAGIMRHNFGDQAHEREIAIEKLKGFAAEFDRNTKAENYEFIDAMEHGTALTNPKWAPAAKALRELLDAKRQQVQDLGKGQLENFIENYFPHIWKDNTQAVQFYGRRPLTGGASFLKQRLFDDFKDGLRWRAYGEDGFIASFDTKAEAEAAAPEGGGVAGPLTPITDNPVELALLKTREMDRYIYGQKIFQEMKDAKLAKFVGFGKKPPAGWVKINDKVARVFQPNEGEGGGMILRGEYYAPDEAGTLINNHLTPGLQGHGAFDAWRKIGGMMNSAQLGLSLFHVGFTTMDSMVSKIALGVKEMARGDVVAGAVNVAQGINPAQPFLNLYKGDKLLRAYLGHLDNPELAPIVDALIEAGARVRMDDIYRNASINAFKQGLRQGGLGGNLQAAKELIPTILDRINAPIFEHLVPRQKLGVFFDMAKDYLERNPASTLEERRAAMGEMWDSVDNRMGLLVYDNVFWNRVLKDGLMASVRSVGWNLGTFRELGGGAIDALNVKDIIKRKGITDRTAYVVALPFITAVYGAMLQYLYTGEPPRESKDYFYPRTGRLRPDGTEDRVTLPTYMKDVYAYAEDVTNFTKFGTDPTQTLKNKAHPLIATLSQMLANEDFFGANIRNPSSPIVEQLTDEAKYLGKQMEPFSLRNYQQQAKQRGVDPSVLDYITSPSMFGVTPAPGYIVKNDAENESSAVSRLREPLMARYRQEIKDGAKFDDVIPKMIRSGLSRRDIQYVLRSSGDTPLPHRLKSFGRDNEPAAGNEEPTNDDLNADP